MYSNKVPGVALWLLVAVSAPLVQVAGRDGWLPVLATSAIACGLWLLVLRFGGNPKGKWHSIFQCLWLCVILSQFLRWSVTVWPTGNAYPVVPMVLLLLAAAAAGKGVAASSSVGSILFWVLLLLYGCILFSGGRDLQVSWMLPQWHLPSPTLGLVLLVPAAAGLLPVKKSNPWWIWSIAAFASAVSLWTIGSLSFGISRQMAWPFYHAAKSVHVLGVAERLEAFVSVASTLGYFALYSLLLNAAGAQGEKIKQAYKKPAIITVATIAGVLTVFPPIPPEILGIGSLLAWVLLPLLWGRKSSAQS